MSSLQVRRYVQKYVAVSDAFIDDFFAHYDVERVGNAYVIDLETVAGWLGVRKSTLKRTLVRTYTKDIDYTVNKIYKSAPRGGAKREQILMTADCFKALCMMSRTPKAAEVRAYYIAVEKAFLAYRNELSAAKDQRIEALERNQRGRTVQVRRKGKIYVIQASAIVRNLFKLGKTVQEYDRMQSHNRALADDLVVKLEYETDHVDCVESCAKLVLRGRQYRKRKEVYQVTLPQLQKIIESCGETCNLQATHRRRGARAAIKGGDGASAPAYYYAVIVKKE